MMINFNPKSMRTHLKIPRRNPESMHPVPKRVRGTNNKAISQLHEALYIEGHLGI
jgi:hypothetical protein